MSGPASGSAQGAALSALLRGSCQVCLVFFGDGASNEGIFHEALNVASLWKLPVVYLCENNEFGLSTAMSESTAVDRISKRAASYGMPGETIDGNDIAAVFAVVTRAAERARSGQGPTLIEAMTYRWGDHSMRANLPRYRTEDEEGEWRERDDPLARTAALLEERQSRPAALKKLASDALAEIESTVRDGEDGPRADCCCVRGCRNRAASRFRPRAGCSRVGAGTLVCRGA